MAGSIQDRGNGSYFLTVSAGFKADGKRNRKTRTVQAKNITEARKNYLRLLLKWKQVNILHYPILNLLSMLRLRVRMQQKKFLQKQLKRMIMY